MNLSQGREETCSLKCIDDNDTTFMNTSFNKTQDTYSVELHFYHFFYLLAFALKLEELQSHLYSRKMNKQVDQ